MFTHVGISCKTGLQEAVFRCTRAWEDQCNLKWRLDVSHCRQILHRRCISVRANRMGDEYNVVSIGR